MKNLVTVKKGNWDKEKWETQISTNNQLQWWTVLQDATEDEAWTIALAFKQIGYKVVSET